MYLCHSYPFAYICVSLRIINEEPPLILQIHTHCVFLFPTQLAQKMDVFVNGGESVLESCRIKELKAFDNTKLGVKGIVDSGIPNVPKMFA